MSQSLLRLFADEGLVSPYVFSAFVALQEKALPFELRPVSLARGEQFSTEYRKLSLTARVPTLQHDDLALSESSAIVEYLEEVFPPPGHAGLLPRNPISRARARQVSSWLRTDLAPLREERPSESIFMGPVYTSLSPAARAGAEKLVQIVDRLLPAGASTLFTEWCLADAELAFVLQRLLANGDEVPARIADYARTTWQRPSVQAFVSAARPEARCS
jgi:glutathione S-transferase